MRIVAPMPQEGGPRQNQQKKNFFLRGDLRPLPNKNVQMLDHFFPFLFPKDSESLKILDIRLPEVGAKRPLNGTSKVKKMRKKKKFARRFQTIFKQKFLYLRPLLSRTIPQGFRISKNIGHLTSGSGGKQTVKKDRKPKKTKKSEKENFFLRGNFRQFSNKNVYI